MKSKRHNIFVGSAVVLLIIALLSIPERITPDLFSDQGEAFYPEFTDPNMATSLEVIDFDETSGSAVPFKVTFKDGLWDHPFPR